MDKLIGFFSRPHLTLTRLLMMTHCLLSRVIEGRDTKTCRIFAQEIGHLDRSIGLGKLATQYRNWNIKY
jgi:hypothetical protein